MDTLRVVRIYGGYAVVLAENAELENADLAPGSILAAFATDEQAERFVRWLTVLRAGYHGAKPVQL